MRRLVQRLHDPKRPLSRNRHFHTFSTPEGQRALRTSRRLRSLQQDILACQAAGRPASIRRHHQDDGTLRIELRMEEVHGSRLAHLYPDEYELLLELDGVRAALEDAKAEGSAA